MAGSAKPPQELRQELSPEGCGRIGKVDFQVEGAALPRPRGDRSEGGGTSEGVKEVHHPAGGRAGGGDGR